MIFNKKILPGVAISLILALSLIVQPSASYAAFDSGRIIDDVVFQDFNSMSAAQVDAFLNSFPTSCISTNRGFQTPEPTGWSSSVTTNHGFTFGGMVSAGTAISRAAAIYNVSPKTILATLQKEQSLVTGGAGCYYDTPSTSASFSCDLYSNGTTYSCTNACPYSGGCVTIAVGMGCPYNCDASYNGFSIQLIAGTWLLRFAQQRAYGNLTGYAGYDTTDENTHYSGAMTQGYRKRSASSPLIYYDGTYTPKDSSTITVQNGSTASLYYFTPFINGNRSFYNRFTEWFGSTRISALPGCNEATNTTRACIWHLISPTGKPYYTASVLRRDYLAMDLDYSFQSSLFFGNAVQLAGNIPVYRLETTGGGSFITSDKNEYDTLSSSGYTASGIDFWADPANSNSGYPVYRLYSSGSETHRWTGNSNDINFLTSNGYVVEGVAFTSISPVRQEVAPPVDRQLTYRFYIPQSHNHLWTNSILERDSMILAGYQYEGVSWHTHLSSSKKPVYRLFAPSLKKHLYTTDESERSALIASGGYNYEGVSFYVEPVATAKPVYRLYAPSLGKHHFTLDANERNVLLSSGKWNDEGIAWYQP